MRTVENRTDEKSSKICLFMKVQIVCDFGSIGVTGPRLFPSVRHGSDVHRGGRVSVEGGVELERRGIRDGETLQSSTGEKWLGVIKTQGRSIER